MYIYTHSRIYIYNMAIHTEMSELIMSKYSRTNTYDSLPFAATFEGSLKSADLLVANNRDALLEIPCC